MAFAGLLLPLVPVTPFMLLSAWSAAKGSPRLHHWIWHHPRMGRFLRDWHKQGAISSKIKWLASAMLLTSWIVLLFTVHWAVLAIMTLLFIVIALFIWSRPIPINQWSPLHESK
jgi:hypothetical protein